MREAIIVDVDGTLAIRGDRGPFDWMKVNKDTPSEKIVNLVRLLGEEYLILVFSGRDEICRGLTEDWLQEYSIPYYELFMRPEGDNRKDCIIKRELYEKHVKGQFTVAFVLDDRDQVVKMWREEIGLTCLQVAPGDF